MFSEEEISLMRENVLNRGIVAFTNTASMLQESAFIDSQVKKAKFAQMSSQEFRTNISDINDKIRLVVAEGKATSEQAKELNEFVKNSGVLTKVYDESLKNKRKRNITSLGLTSLAVIVGIAISTYVRESGGPTVLLDEITERVKPLNTLMRGEVEEVGDSLFNGFREVKKVTSDLVNSEEFQQAKGTVDAAKKEALGRFGGLFENIGYSELTESLDRVNNQRTNTGNTSALFAGMIASVIGTNTARLLFGSNFWTNSATIVAFIAFLALMAKSIATLTVMSAVMIKGRLGKVNDIADSIDNDKLIRIFEDDKKNADKRKAERSRWLKSVISRMKMTKKDQENLI